MNQGKVYLLYFGGATVLQIPRKRNQYLVGWVGTPLVFSEFLALLFSLLSYKWYERRHAEQTQRGKLLLRFKMAEEQRATYKLNGYRFGEMCEMVF